MLELLTQYLSRTRSLTIPHLGSFALEAVPAHWNVVDQEILGPSEHLSLQPEGSVAPRQISWLADVLRESEQGAADRLESFGRQLREQLQHAPFHWPGLGLLEWKEGALQLQPHIALLPDPVRAGRIQRDDARHTVLVGEQEMRSAARNAEAEVATAPGKTDIEWLAWLLVVLAALFVLYILFSEGFSVKSTGLQTRAGAF